MRIRSSSWLLLRSYMQLANSASKKKLSSLLLRIILSKLSAPICLSKSPWNRSFSISILSLLLQTLSWPCPYQLKMLNLTRLKLLPSWLCHREESKISSERIPSSTIWKVLPSKLYGQRNSSKPSISKRMISKWLARITSFIWVAYHFLSMMNKLKRYAKLSVNWNFSTLYAREESQKDTAFWSMKSISLDKKQWKLSTICL